MIARFLPLLAFVAACSGELPTAPTPPPAAVHQLHVDVNAHQLDAVSLAHLRAIGASSVRTTLYWGPTVSDADLTAFARDIAAARAAGLRVLIVVHDEPTQNKGLPWSARVDAFAAYIERAVVIMPGCDWELFNEIDVDGFDNLFATSSDISDSAQTSIGARYGSFLNVVVPRMRRADPSATIATAGVTVNVRAFFAGMRSTATVDVDAISVHAYGFPNSAQFVDNFRRARAAFPSTPIWATEFGMDDGQIPGSHSGAQFDQLQRDDIAKTIAADPGFARAYVYVLHTGQDRDYAIFRGDWSSRPSADWIGAQNGR